VWTVLGGVFASALAYYFGLTALSPDPTMVAPDQANRARLALNDMESNPNTLGRLLILPLTLAIAGFVGGRGMIDRALAVGCAAFIAMGMLISMSRSAVVAMATVVLVLFYRMRARWHIVVVMVLLVVAATMMPDNFYRRMNDLISGQDDTGSGRVDIWRTGVQALERSGFLGVGLDNFPLLYKMYAPGRGTGSHNIVLTALLDFGVPGLVLMLTAIGSGLLAVRRARRAGQGSVALSALEAACIGTLMTGMFADILWTKSFWLAWILLTWTMYAEERSDASDTFVPRE
jgi:O-antigen ligase